METELTVAAITFGAFCLGMLLGILVVLATPRDRWPANDNDFIQLPAYRDFRNSADR